MNEFINKTTHRLDLFLKATLGDGHSRGYREE